MTMLWSPMGRTGLDKVSIYARSPLGNKNTYMYAGTQARTHTRADSLWSSVEGSVGVLRLSPVFIIHVISHSSKPQSKPQCQQTLIYQQQLLKEYGRCCQSDINLIINHCRPSANGPQICPFNIKH